jgi:hypothetical protein
MATLERQTHRVGASLEVKDVEKLLGELEDRREAPSAWHLDLSDTRHVQPLAGARLAAAVRQMATEHLSVALPPDENGQRFRVLYRTGLLAAIAAHASEVEGEGDELLAKVERDPQSYSTATNLIVFSRVDQGGLVGQKDRFASRLFGELARHLPGVGRSLAGSTQAALVEAGYEGIANIADHAYTRPFEGSPERTALCLLSWHKEISATSGDRLGLASFIEGTRGRISPDRLHWLQMTLIDDGNGIPARQAIDPEIYEEPLAVEEEVFAKALERGASVKLAAADAPLRGDPGWGLALIAEALTAAGGYGALRSGRQVVTLDPSSPRPGWTLHPDPLAPLRGTVLELILPVEDPQGTLL